MAKRLISLKQIRSEKIDRGRSWIFARVAAGDFPKPVIVQAGSGGNLWAEEEVDAWLQQYIAKAQAERIAA